jgi:hypothetical protein
VARCHKKVAIHSLSLPPSVMSQSSNNRVMVIPRARRVYCLNCHVLTTWKRATTQENLHHMFCNCPYFSVSILSYTYMFVFALVECETVYSQSCVSRWRLLVLPMGGHDRPYATYSRSSLGSYNCSRCS